MNENMKISIGKPVPPSENSPVLDIMSTGPESHQLSSTIDEASEAFKNKRKRVYLYDLLPRLINLLRQKDTYGFFLSPVNVKVVTDYLRVIKEPMDLGTIGKKIKKKQYSDLEEFQRDFKLVCDNSMLYNAPDTIYYKAGEKLKSFGLKLIEKETANLLIENEPPEESPAPSPSEQRSSGRATPTNRISRDRGTPVRYIEHNTAEKPQTRRTAKKVRHWEDLEYILFDIFNEDGTRFEHDISKIARSTLDPFQFFSFQQSIDTLLCVAGFEAQVYRDWNIGTLSPPGPPRNQGELDNVMLSYGDDRGKAYIASLEKFTRDIDPKLLDISKITNYLTRGAHQINELTEAAVEKNVDPGVVSVECGEVSILQQIEKCKTEIEDLLDAMDVEVAKMNASNCIVLSQAPTSGTTDSPITPSVSFLEENMNDFKTVLNSELTREQKLQSLEVIRKKLFALVQFSNDYTMDYGQNVPIKINQINPQQQGMYSQLGNIYGAGNSISPMMGNNTNSPSFNTPLINNALRDPYMHMGKPMLQKPPNDYQQMPINMQQMQQFHRQQQMQQMQQAKLQQMQRQQQMNQGYAPNQIQMMQQMQRAQSHQLLGQSPVIQQATMGNPAAISSPIISQGIMGQSGGSMGNCMNCGAPNNSVGTQSPLCYGNQNLIRM